MKQYVIDILLDITGFHMFIIGDPRISQDVFPLKIKEPFISSFLDLEPEFLIATYREFVEAAAAASLGLLVHARVTAH